MSSPKRPSTDVLDDLKARRLRAANNRATNSVAHRFLVLEGLETLMREHPIPVAPRAYKGKKTSKTDRIVNLMLSDLHYGSDLLADECESDYGPIEESRRTAAVCLAAVEWKTQYRDSSVLYIHLAGDIIEGKLHDPQSAAPETVQFYRALWNLKQALEFLAGHYKAVKVFAVPGNHGRNRNRHPQRAVSQKWDSKEGEIYGALKLILASVPNISFEIPRTPFYRYRAFDQQGFITHGDTVINAGYPNKSISVESVRRQINEMNAKNHCHLFGVGHVHVASTVRLPSGPSLITNGCLIPSGEFGVSIGALHNVCCQQIWESVPGIILGHRMEILVDSRTDADKSLDSIIAPFPGIKDFCSGD